MIRNLKVLGLALCAVLSMSAVAAGGAQAQNGKLTSANYPATIDATTVSVLGKGEEFFESIGRKVECEIAHFDGTLAAPSETLTITPNYTDHKDGGTCDAAGIFKATVTENGCTFLFHTKGTTGVNKHYNITVDVVCGPGGPIVVHIANAAGVDVCTVTIGSQATGGMLTAENKAGHVNLSGTVSVTSTLHSKSAALCLKPIGEHKGIVTNYVINDPITITGNNGDIEITD